MSKVTHRDIREGIVDTCRQMNKIGLNQGTSGNLSHRIPEGFLITPTSLPYERMGPKDIVQMAFDGSYEGRWRPSSEWRFHRDILKARTDMNVVLHTHSTYCTTLAVHEKPIPAFHYMVAVAGSTDIRCAPYACFGTQELSDHALAALEDRTACLLGHHGLIVLAETFEKALWRAVEIETLAKMYVHALAIGEPPRLTEAQMAQVIEQIRRMSYGQAPDLDGVADTPQSREGGDAGRKDKKGRKDKDHDDASAPSESVADLPPVTVVPATVAPAPASRAPTGKKPVPTKAAPASLRSSKARTAVAAPTTTAKRAVPPAATPRSPRSAAARTASVKPAATEPAGRKPSTGTSSSAKPASTKPASVKPASAKSASAKSASAQAAAGKPGRTRKADATPPATPDPISTTRRSPGSRRRPRG